MAFEHESGLPQAFDRAAGKSEQQGVVFYGERHFLQAPELNELQTIARARHNRLGRLVANDGDRIERAEAVVDIDAKTVTLTAGRIYVTGDVFPVDEAVLTNVAMAGRVDIGVRLRKTFVTHEADPTLLGIVPGSEAEGEPGAAREIAAIAWAKANDGGAGDFYAVYTLQDGTIIDQRGPSLLEPAMQALAEYDRAHGHYVVSGCRVTALGANAGAQAFSIEQGEANISGFKRVRNAALRLAEPQEWDEFAIPGETDTYPGGTSYTYEVDQFPIGAINSILLTKEKTVNVVRGAVANGQDALPDTSIIEIKSVVQNATTFAANTYLRTGNTVDWAPAGSEPAVGSTYAVTYRYRASVQPTAYTDRTITVAGGAAGGDIITAYTAKMPRIDRIGLRMDGSPVYIKGISARSNPVPPIVPGDVLPLAKVANDWMSKPVVENDAVRSVPYSEIWRYFNRIVDHDRLIQLERLKSGIDSREPVAKKGVFVDPFTDDSYRDTGAPQTAAIGLGVFQLPITPTFFYATLTAPVMLDYVEEVVSSQELKTACELINPYANFSPLPGSMKLTPAVDFWTVQQTQWLSAQTINLNMGVTFGGPLQTTSVAEQLVDQRSEQAEFLRPIQVAFEIDGFGVGEILDVLTFDGINVKPAGQQQGNASGKISGTFTIPANVTAGTKPIYAKGRANTEASAMFTGQGTIETDIMRRVTTIQTWTQMQIVGTRNSGRGGGFGGSDQGGHDVDPQAQMFSVSEPRQIIGVDFHLCKIGNMAHGLLIEQVTTDNGYPTTDVQAQAFLPMTGAVEGWKGARYRLPVTTLPDRRSAFVIKTDDNVHSVSLAKLGGFDADLQKFVSSHPYVVGPRFSSVNAITWTAHQDEALTFRLVAAKYTATTKVVALGTVNLVQCSDLQIRAAVELPSAECSVVFEVVRKNGTIYRLSPFQVLQLTEYLTETVTLRAVLKGTEKLSPILFAPVEIIAGRIAQEATYITRSMSLGAAVRLTAYLKTYMPSGSTFGVSYSIDGGPFQGLPLAKTDALAFPLWTEKTYQATGLSGQTVRLGITATGGPAARVMAGDFGAGIF